MARFGAFCFPGTGHLYPMFSLLQCLQQQMACLLAKDTIFSAQ